MRCWPRPRRRTGVPPVEARLLNGLNWLRNRRKEFPSRWIIAALCCREGTRWVGLLLRSKAPGSGPGVQPDRFSQPRLSLVKGPKAIGSEFQGTRHMKGVQRTNAERRRVAAGEIGDYIPGSFGKRRRLQETGAAVEFEVLPCTPGNDFRNTPEKHLPIDRIRKFGVTERGNRQIRARCHTPVRLDRMRVGQVNGYKKARIGIDDQ